MADQPETQPPRRRSVGWWIGAALLPVSLFLDVAAGWFPAQIEAVYSRGLYPWLAQPISLLTGWLPFSLAEFLVLVGLLVGLFGLVFVPLRLIVHRKRRGPRWRRFLTLCYLGLSVLVAWFVFGWGLNYARQPVASALGLTVQPAPTSQLISLTAALVREANQVRAGLPEDAQGVSRLLETGQTLPARAIEAYRLAAARDPKWQVVAGGSYGPAKAVTASDLFGQMAIAGIYFPFTGEANFNASLPAAQQAATICHEMAHQRGWAREDEANFISFLVCYQSGQADFRYSGLLMGLVHSLNALAAVDRPTALQLREQLWGGVRRDLQANTNYYNRFNPVFQQAAQAVNNAYLQANRQADGVRSYGRVVDLLLAWQTAGGLTAQSTPLDPRPTIPLKP